MPFGCTLCSCRKNRSRRGSRSGLRGWAASGLPLRVLPVLPVRLRALRLLWDELVCGRSLYWRRALVPWLLRRSPVLRPPGLLARTRGSRTGLLWARASQLRARTDSECPQSRLRSSGFPRRQRQITSIPNSKPSRPAVAAAGRRVLDANQRVGKLVATACCVCCGFARLQFGKSPGQQSGTLSTPYVLSACDR